jgi:hypothetical protein
MANANEYGRIWWSWWISLQPSWREGETVCKAIPTDVDWSQLMEGGPLGIALIVMTLAWWLAAEGDNAKAFANSRLAAAIADITWVLEQLVLTLERHPMPSASTSNSAPASKASKPKSKRAGSPTSTNGKPRSKW